MNAIIPCPGCRLELPDLNQAGDVRFNASEACWALYGELSAFTLTRQDAFFIHQLALDAYSAQHAGGSVKPINTVFALAGLYLANERGFTGRQVQLAHTELAKRPNRWPILEPPAESGIVTVRDVQLAKTDERKQDMIREWSASVWGSWEHRHEWVRELCKDL